MRPSPLTTQAGLTFTDYFKLNLDTDEVAGYFGYGYTRAALDLPHSADLHDLLQIIISILQEPASELV